MRQIELGSKIVTQDGPTYVIAEIGNNHGGDIDLAKKMIKKYGNEEQIEITYTGLRGGEKLYEELLTSAENLKKTSNNNLFIADVKVPSYESVIFILEQIGNSLNYDSNDLNSLVKYLKDIMPEFISNNSKYQALDVLKK